MRLNSPAISKVFFSPFLAILIWNQSIVGFADSSLERASWPALARWTASLNLVMQSSDNQSQRIDRVSYLLTEPEDVMAARVRLKLTEGALPKVDNSTRRYIGGGDEVCEYFRAGDAANVLEVIRHRLAVKKRLLDASVSREETLLVVSEVRAAARLNEIQLCEAVLLDDSDHDEPVYIHAFTIGGGKHRKNQKKAMIVVETRW